jgi:predicted nucleic acid-binding protein
VIRLFELKVEHNNSSLADVSCYLLAQETGRPLLTGDGKLRARHNEMDWRCTALFGYLT